MKQPPPKPSRPPRPTVSPRVDVYENERALLFLADIPGVAEEDVELEVSDDQMFLRARRTSSPPGRPASEPVLDYSRSFTIPRGIDIEDVKATLHNGELRVKIPKDPMPARRLDVISEIEPDNFELLFAG